MTAAHGGLAIDTQMLLQPGPSTGGSGPLAGGWPRDLSPATTATSDDASARTRTVTGASYDSGSDDDDEDAKKKSAAAANAGRRKIDIEYITEKNKRHITFSKRKAGIMKKAYELSRLTGTDVLLLIVSETGLVYTFTTPKLDPLINAKRGKALIQHCISDNPSSAYRKDLSEPRIRQYMAPKAAAPEPSSRSPARAQPRQRTISQPRRLPPPQQISSSAAKQEEEENDTHMADHTMQATTAAHNNNPPADRNIKRRKTVDDLRSAKQMQAQEAVDQSRTLSKDTATLAMNEARANPTIDCVLRAYQAQQEAQRQSHLDAYNEDFGPNQMLREVMRAVEQMRFMPANGQSHVTMLPNVFYFFLTSYLPTTLASHDYSSSASFRDELRLLAGWCSAQSLVDTSTYLSMARQCDMPSPTQTSVSQMPSNPLSNSLPSLTSSASSVIARSSRAAIMLAEYAAFSFNRYRNHFEPSLPAVQGTFFVQMVSETFILLDELQISTDPMVVSEEAPFKIRMPQCLNALLQRGDNIECTIQKAQGSSFWLPVSSGRLVEVPEGRVSPEYMPQIEACEVEMERCHENGDSPGYTAAYEAFVKESRAAELLSFGEFDDEGFVPSEMMETPPW